MKVTKGRIADFFCNFVSRRVKAPEINICLGVYVCEVERSLCLPQIPVKDSSGAGQGILLVWKHTASVLPNLSKIARQLLTARASSASA